MHFFFCKWTTRCLTSFLLHWAGWKEEQKETSKLDLTTTLLRHAQASAGRPPHPQKTSLIKETTKQKVQQCVDVLRDSRPQSIWFFSLVTVRVTILKSCQRTKGDPWHAPSCGMLGSRSPSVQNKPLKRNTRLNATRETATEPPGSILSTQRL